MKILGMETDELSIRDLVQELSDLKKDLRNIDDCKAGVIPPSELSMYSSYKVSDRELVEKGINELTAEIQRRRDLEIDE